MQNVQYLVMIMKNKSYIIFFILILLFNCDNKKDKEHFFLSYLKESRIVENEYWDGENNDTLNLDTLIFDNLEPQGSDTIFEKNINYAYAHCHLYKTDSTFHDTLYYIGIIHPPMPNLIGYLLLFNEDEKLIDQLGFYSKYNIADISIDTISGLSKKLIIIDRYHGGIGIYHHYKLAYTIQDNKFGHIYAGEPKYEAWYDEEKVMKDSTISFYFNNELNQFVTINECKRGNELNDTFEIEKIYFDTSYLDYNFQTVEFF